MEDKYEEIHDIINELEEHFKDTGDRVIADSVNRIRKLLYEFVRV